MLSRSVVAAALAACIAPSLSAASSNDAPVIMPARKADKPGEIASAQATPTVFKRLILPKSVSAPKTETATASTPAKPEPKASATPAKQTTAAKKSSSKKPKPAVKSSKPKETRVLAMPVRSVRTDVEEAAADTVKTIASLPGKTKSAVTSMGSQVFNTDYRTRPGSADIPTVLAGNGIGGRNLPLAQEDNFRLTGNIPSNYMPTDLQLVPQQWWYYGQPVYLRRDAAASLHQMFCDAARHGLTLKIFSGYRDYNHQSRLYREAVARNGKNQKGVAKPGKSEHFLGTTADVTNGKEYLMKRSFINTPEGQWLAKNAHRYGWRMTVMSGEGARSHGDEPWHIRYFGVGSSPMDDIPKESIVSKAKKGFGKLLSLGR